MDRFIRESRSWDAFFKKACALPASAPGGKPDKGKVFERLTQLYLKTHPEYRTKLKHVWRAKDELPPTVRKKIGLPRADEGIDLVAETRDGALWAVQCKFRTDTRQPLTVTELGTFANLAFNYCRRIALAVVVHTCAKPVRKAQLLKTTEIGLERWLELDAQEWNRIRAATTKAPPAPKRRTPRPHQKKAIAAAKKHFLKGKASRGRMLMPCGTGKSLTAFWIAEALKARSILVAVPSLHLIKQSLADWTREFLARGEIPDWLCVCSDESTGRLERDEFVGGSYELGVDATTDQAEIRRFLSHKNGRRKIVFATYQSGKPLARAARAAKFAFDLGIMDEAHRTVGSPDKSFGHLLAHKNIAIAKRLFMTATERVVRERDEAVLSMDDPRLYGECFHQLSFKEAIAARPPIISDYKVLTITVSDEKVKELIRKNRYLRTGDRELGEREAQALAAGVALQRAFREEGVKHAISFHRSIRAAEEFKDQHNLLLRGKNRLASFHISSKKSAGERADLLREFRESPTALITNARCLQEGVDIPAVDCVLFADPKQSVVDIVQAAGRAMRPSKGKKFGYIVVPIIVPSGMEFSEFAETTEFKQVARVVTALSTQDDRIAEEFRGHKTKDRRRSGERIVEIKGDVPVALKINLQKFREQVRLKLWERVGRVNWRPFEEAREFAHGLGLKTQAEWIAFTKSTHLPSDIPANPDVVYSDKGWSGVGDWLGTWAIAKQLRKYRAFLRARAFVRSLGLKSMADWFQYRTSGQLPSDIPSNPNLTYKAKGWAGYGDWLGTGVVASRLVKHRHFIKARAFARNLGLNNRDEWNAFCKSGRLPSDIPANPQRTYKDKGWAGNGDWLGTWTIALRLRKYMLFAKARAFARNLKLKSHKDWRTFSKSDDFPADMPVAPDQIYKNKGWAGWGDWLGTGTIATHLRRYRSFTKARAYIRSLGIKGQREWRDYSQRDEFPSDIPAAPHRIYKDKGWVGYGDWLGTGAIAPRFRKFSPSAKARLFVRSLDLQSSTEWVALIKSGGLPSDIPTKPYRTYAGKGWTDWSDWLGTKRLPRQRKR